MSDAPLRVEIHPGEIRWLGPPDLDETVLAAVRSRAAAAGSATIEIVETHVQKATQAKLLADGSRAWPHAGAGTEGSVVWSTLRDFAELLRRLDESEFVRRSQALEGSRRDAMRAVAAMCDLVARAAPMALVGYAHRGELSRPISEAQHIIDGWMKVPVSDANAMNGARSKVDAFRKALDEVVAKLAPLTAWSALHAIAEPHSSLLTGYSEVITATLAEQQARVAAALQAAEQARERSAALEAQAQRVLNELRVTSGAAAVTEWKETFGLSATDHAKKAVFWIVAAVVLGGVAAVAAWYALWASAPPRDWIALVHELGPRILMVAIPLSASIWSARMSTMHRRAQIADSHRFNALSTYVRLSESAPSEEGRAAVLAAVTSCVFGRTASLDHGLDPGLAVFSELARAAKNARE